MMQIINQMSDDEIAQMLGVYLVEMLKYKMIQDGKIPAGRLFVNPERLH
jgi:hypothetical protein